MKKSLITGVIVVLLAVGGYFGFNEVQTLRGQQALDHTGLQFRSLDAAFAESKASGKPVLVDFSAIWCPTCRALHEHVFTDAKVKQAIQSGYVLARVDYDSPQAPAFMKTYDVTGFPSILVLDADGKLVRHVPVTLQPDQFTAELGG